MMVKPALPRSIKFRTWLPSGTPASPRQTGHLKQQRASSFPFLLPRPLNVRATHARNHQKIRCHCRRSYCFQEPWSPSAGRTQTNRKVWYGTYLTSTSLTRTNQQKFELSSTALRFTEVCRLTTIFCVARRSSRRYRHPAPRSSVSRRTHR